MLIRKMREFLSRESMRDVDIRRTGCFAAYCWVPGIVNARLKVVDPTPPSCVILVYIVSEVLDIWDGA
jgi:hypothetical protein